MNEVKQWFERSGYASLDDFEAEGWKSTFAKLEKLQADFLSNETHFRSEDYTWPRDPLHSWSRLWEYPYVFANLKSWRAQMSGACPLKVLDFGSGVTFFPFALATEGFDITALDVDPIVQRDFSKAAEVMKPSHGKVDFVFSSGNTVDLPDNSFNVVYSISVLEHIPDPCFTISEIARILIPNGLCILTVDLGLIGDRDIKPSPYLKFRKCLAEHFDLLHPEITLHPLRILCDRNSPSSQYRQLSTRGKAIQWLRRRIGRMFALPTEPQGRLTCAGLAFMRKA